MKKRLPRVKGLGSRWDRAIDRWADALEMAAGLTATPPLLIADTPGGKVVSLDEPPRMLAELLTNVGAGVYTFEEVHADTGGTFVTMPDGRTGDCREYNGNASIPLTSPVKVVELRWFGEVEEWRFQSGACS